MTIQYIRETYNVPAKRGGRIEFTQKNGAKFQGTITGSDSQYLHVRFDCFTSKNAKAKLHPTYNIKYL
jgi:hypothetical protein